MKNWIEKINKLNNKVIVNEINQNFLKQCNMKCQKLWLPYTTKKLSWCQDFHIFIYNKDYLF